MRVKNQLFAVTAAAVLLTLSGHSVAQQPSLADRETARSLMDEGDRKRDAGDVKGALKNYEAADSIMKVPTTGLEVARAQVALGLLLEARETLGRVLRLPPRPGEPAPFAAARKAADTMNSELAARIPSIQIVVSNTEPGQPAQITVDNDPISPAAANVPRKVNPGTHVIVVRSGSLEKKQDISVVERDNKTISVDLKDQPPPVKEKPPPPPVEEPKKTVEGSSTSTMLMYGGFGVAAVGVGVGTVTGLMSISKTNELKASCPNDKCPINKQSEINSATSLGTIATIAFVVGGVGLGVGIVGLVTSGGDKKEPPASAALAGSARSASPFTPQNVRAVLGPSYVGVAGAF